MAFNKDEMVAPAWLTNGYFEKVLKQSENDAGLTVTKSKIVPGTKPGDHFASIIFRAAICYKSRGKDAEISVIIKTVPEEEGIKRDLHKSGYLFQTETTMYNTIIPEMHRLLRSVGDETVLSPRLLYSSDNPALVMMFEDISKRDYAMKYSQLNLEEAKIVYAKLARIHAASTFLVDTMPIIKELDKGVGNIGGELTFIWEGHIATLAKVCKGWPGYESYGERLDKIKSQIIGKLQQVYNYSTSTLYNVLNHGDCHFKNMMFKTFDGTTKDIMLLDYQISIWGTPAIDIIYSLYNTCSVETRDNHRDELIKFYHDEYVTILNKFGYLKKIPSLIELHIEIVKNGYLETFLACTFLPFMVLTIEEMMPEPAANSEEGFDFDYDDKEKMQQMIIACFQHPKYASVIKRYLPMLLHKGYLEM